MVGQRFPWRMILRGAFQDGWLLADQAEKNRVFEHWIATHERWREQGCRLIATLDDELNMVGQPGSRLWNFYSIWEIPDPAITYELLNMFRDESEGTIRLDRYFRFEVVVGKPVGGLERGLGGVEMATTMQPG